VCIAKLTHATYPELRAALGKASVPDVRGIFLRGYGSQSHAQENGSTVGVTSTTHASGALGNVQGDSIRPVTGRTNTFQEAYYAGGSPSGAFHSERLVQQDGGINVNGRPAANHTTYLDITRVVPTAVENRPVNTAVRYLIRAQP
jgi:hypothetical protein